MMEMFIFTAVLLTLIVVGTPIAHAIILSVSVYLFASSQDIALASEQLLSNIFNNFLLLSVPLFIMFASIMNASKMTDKLLDFCMAIVGHLKGWIRDM